MSGAILPMNEHIKAYFAHYQFSEAPWNARSANGMPLLKPPNPFSPASGQSTSHTPGHRPYEDQNLFQVGAEG